MIAPRSNPCPNCNGDGRIRFVNRSADPRWAGPILCPHCYGVGLVAREVVTLGDLAMMVSRDLPEGWEVTLVLDPGMWEVELCDPDGNEVVYPSNRETIEWSLVDALQHAIASAKDEGGDS